MKTKLFNDLQLKLRVFSLTVLSLASFDASAQWPGQAAPASALAATNAQVTQQAALIATLNGQLTLQANQLATLNGQVNALQGLDIVITGRISALLTHVHCMALVTATDKGAFGREISGSQSSDAAYAAGNWNEFCGRNRAMGLSLQRFR